MPPNSSVAPTPEAVLDCVVVGGGPAGLAAATYLARARRSHLVVDDGRSRARWIPTSRNVPGFPGGVTGEALLGRLRAEAARFGVGVLRARATALSRDAAGFRLETDAGPVLARTVLLACGVEDREPDQPDETGLYDAVKRGLVRICPICDAYEASGLNLGVIGSCDHAAAEALFLRTYSDRVTVVVPRHLGRVSDARRRDLREAGVRLIETDAQALRVHGDDVGCMAVDGHEHRFDVIYAALGSDPRNALARSVGARLGEDGRLETDPHGRTSVEGVYAAGDIVRGLNQVAVAWGEAAQAAIAIHNSLPRNFA